MALRYTPFTSIDDINPLELNERLTELSNSVDGVVDGSEGQTPSISDFTNATHDHEDAAGGGQLVAAAINTESATDGQVLTSDGGGNAAWEDAIGDFLDLSDTPASYAGKGGYALAVNSGETAVEAVPRVMNIDSYTLDEASDYTTTSTSFVNVDATNLSFDITVQSGSRGIEVIFDGVAWNSTGGQLVYFDFTIDGTPHAGDNGETGFNAPTASYRVPFGFHRYVSLSAGTYTVNLTWKVTAGTGTLSAGAGTSAGDFHPQMIVKEWL